MSSSKAPSPLHTADYEAIEAALLQSARGRWFLAEFIRQNRSADTRLLLDAITKLEAAVLQPRGSAQSSHMRRDLIEMAEAISKTRGEIAAMRPADVDDCKFTTATEELDAIIETTEKATSEILTSAEEVQETAWLMREDGVSEETCDRLDALATDIYTACSFQDLTGQRTSKVVQTLRFLENRVMAMIDIWGLDEEGASKRADEGNKADSHLLNGPARRGEGIDQLQVDLVIDFDKDTGGVIGGVPAPCEPAAGPAEEAEASATVDTPAVDTDERAETNPQALYI